MNLRAPRTAVYEWALVSGYRVGRRLVRIDEAGDDSPSNCRGEPRKWGVAIQTLVRRARSLGVINDNQYRYLFQQIGRRGWRLREPEQTDIPVEKPRAFRRMVEVLCGEPLDYRLIARDLRLHPHLVKQIMEGYSTRGQLPRRGSSGQPTILDFPRPKLVE